jgi:ABC-type bacteriocin/lantibiotic exporter with double-glycine peptidase domain
MRLVPSLSKLLSAGQTLKFGESTVKSLYKELAQNLAQEERRDVKVSFQNLEIVNLNYSYENVAIFKRYNLKIMKGDKVAVIGGSGSGKTTLIDIISGFRIIDDGDYRINEEKANPELLKTLIAYIPQNIFIFNADIYFNIGLKENIDMNNFISSLKNACLEDLLSGNYELKNNIGEGGLNLSGGQKQRIGIARGLYSNKEILVIDEGTSGLDANMSHRLVKNLMENYAEKTIIFSTHNPSLLKYFDYIIDMDNLNA